MAFEAPVDFDSFFELETSRQPQIQKAFLRDVE